MLFQDKLGKIVFFSFSFFFSFFSWHTKKQLYFPPKNSPENRLDLVVEDGCHVKALLLLVTGPR
jgi:hypothetical protein